MISNKIVLCILMILLGIGAASADTLNVGQGQTYPTIQSAIDSAKTGDVISVGEGTFSENLVIKKNGISITGKNGEKTIIDGRKIGSGIKIDGSNNVRISGLTVQNSGGSGQDDAGISLYRANNNVVINTILINNAVGISIYSGSNNNTVSGNEISSNGNYGIFIFSSNDNNIYNNNIQGNKKFGLYADSARTNHIYSNNFIDNQAYDNSGLNSWDGNKSGNYWSTYKKGSGPNLIPGGAKAQDNYPLSGAVTIKTEEVPASPEKSVANAETKKSTPGFSGIAVLVSVIILVLTGRKTR